MTLLIDAAPLIALADRQDRARPDVQAVLARAPGPLVVPAPVTAEVDYLLGVRLGAVARRAFLTDLAAGRFQVESLDRAEHGRALDLDGRYADLDLGLADLSVVVLADRFATRDVLTFDHRHFRTVAPLQGGAFRLLPADC